MLIITQKMKTFLILLSIIILSSCTDSIKSKGNYPENNTAEIAELKNDSTAPQIADIPIHIDSTDYLLHPIGEYKMQRSYGKMTLGASSYGSGTFSIANYNNFEITGNMFNIKFQELNSEKLSPLTSKNIRIKSVSFLREVFDINKYLMRNGEY